jgi:uncharacterized protein
MMIIDAGPLVAAFNRKERHHAWVLEKMKENAGPYFTTESVLSEAFHLLENNGGGTEVLLKMLERGALRVALEMSDHVPAIVGLIRRYADQPMSLADATLVRLAELHEQSAVFTLDKHFLIYRKHGRRQIPLIFPEKQ